MTPQEERAEQVKALLDATVRALVKGPQCGDFRDTDYEHAVAELAQFVRLHHGLLETHNGSILATMDATSRLIDGLREEARKQNDVLAGLVLELGTLRRTTGR